MQKTFRQAVLAAAFTTLAAVAPAAADSTGVTNSAIKIGFVGSITGPAAIWGSGNLAGATLAFEEINAAGGVHGRKIDFLSIDDETSAPKGIAGLNRLVNDDKVFAIFGPSSSAVGVPMKDALQKSGVPVVIPSFSSPLMTEPPMKNVFRSGTLNDRQQGRGIANYLYRDSGLKRIAIMRQSDEYGLTGANSIATRLKELGAEPVAVEIFNTTDTDFTSQVLRVRSAKPDAVVVYGYPAASATITRQLREMGVKGEIIGSSATSNQNYPQMVGKLGAGVKMATMLQHLPEGDHPPMVRFREAFQKRYPELVRQGRPAISDVLGYGGALIMIEGLQRAGKDLTRENFIKAMETLENFDAGVIAPTTFTADRHEGNVDMYIAVIKDDLTREVLPKSYDTK